jgi:hypothetical protein
LAAMAMLAPSRAARSAMARPIPRDASGDEQRAAFQRHGRSAFDESADDAERDSFDVVLLLFTFHCLPARRGLAGTGCIGKRQHSLMQVPARDIQR